MRRKSLAGALGRRVNFGDGDNITWNQFISTGVTINAGMSSRIAAKGSDPTKFGRLT